MTATFSPSRLRWCTSAPTGPAAALAGPGSASVTVVERPSRVTCPACREYVALVRQREAEGLRRLPEGALRRPTALPMDREAEYALFGSNSAEIARVDH